MRNFFYNKSDILVALGIILVALIIIIFRVNALMDFHGKGTAEVPQTSEVTEIVTEEGEEAGEPEGAIFEIKAGATGDSIAEDLFNAGLIASTEEFTDEVKAQGAATKLKTGKFTIPEGASVSEIVTILIS